MPPRTQHALKLEQARLAQYGVAMDYLPTINTSMYSPSLFSSTEGTYSGTFPEQAQELHRMQSDLLSQEEKVIESEAALVLEYGVE